MESKNTNKMSKWGATSYIIGNTVGSGIFITPQSILAESTSIGVSLIIWLVSAIVSSFGAICYVELGTGIRRNGADYAYISYVKWKSVAFTFMACGCILNYPATLVIQSETFAEYLLRAFNFNFCNPEYSEYWARKFISFTIRWLILYINFFSVRSFIAKFQIVASICKLFSSGIIIIIGLYVLLFTDVGAKNLANPFANSTINLGSLTSAFFAGLYSYDGWDVLNFGAEEVENPASTMLFAILVGMSTVTVVFMAMNLAFFIVLPVEQIEKSSAVAMTFAQETMGNFQYIMPLLVSIVLIGSINSSLFSASRYVFAAARNQQFPHWISCINYKHDSPRAALFFSITLSFVFSFVGDLNSLLNYVGFSQWIQRFITVLALFYIRFCNKAVHPDTVRIPIIISIIFFSAIVLLIGTTIIRQFSSCWLTLLILGVSFACYHLCISKKALISFIPCIYYYLHSINVATSRFAQIIFNGIIEADEEEEDFNMDTMQRILNDQAAAKLKYDQLPTNKNL